MTTLADALVPDELSALAEPLLPIPPPPPYGGRRRSIADRACLAAIVFMARTSTPWRLLVRWDRDSGRWFAFVLLACALVCCSRR